MAISYNVATYSPDYIITIMVEIGFKYSAGNIYIHVYFEKLQLLYSVGNTHPILLDQNITPSFDVFYLHKYFHDFSNFNDTLILGFFKMK